MTIPRQGSANGEHGFPVVEGKNLRVCVDGDMHRGVAAYDIDEGWADIIELDDHGLTVWLDKAAGVRKLKRYRGKVEVFEV